MKKQTEATSPYDEYLDMAGICRRCHKRPRAKGHVLCLDCGDYFRWHSMLQREQRIDDGRCAACGRVLPEADAGHKVCASCRERRHNEQVKLRKAWADAGRCYVCGRVSVAGTGYKACFSCRMKDRRRRGDGGRLEPKQSLPHEEGVP